MTNVNGAPNGANGVNGTDGASHASQYISTLPGPGHNWQVSLEGKVIASE